MAFGINREELRQWKETVKANQIAIITHYWEDKRFPGSTSVTKIGCNDVDKLVTWGKKYGLKAAWIDYNHYPHFDVFGEKQKEILQNEGLLNQIKRFNL